MSEDFNKLRLTARKLVKTEFRKPWQFRIEIEGAPADFDLFVKDISYGPTQVENEAEKVGSSTMTWPTGLSPVKLSMTMREHQDLRVSKWFDAWVKKVANSDGTVNLPFGTNGYVKKIKSYALKDDLSEALEDTWGMYPDQRGDVSMSRDAEGFLEFPCTFQQFRTNDAL